MVEIIPIRKQKKPPDCRLSYRPISLLYSISKILKKIIKNKLVNFIEMRNIIPTQQFAFCNFNLQKSTDMVLLDIKAGFNTVWHEDLIYKMIMYDFPKYLIKIIQNFISQR